MWFPQSPQVELEEQQLSFSAVGHGAQGEKKYGFTLQLLRPIDTEVMVFLSFFCSLVSCFSYMEFFYCVDKRQFEL